MCYFRWILLFGFALSLSIQLNAQQLYLRGSAGYALKLASQNIDFYNHTSDTSSFNDSQVDVNFGKGWNGGLAAGYFFNPHIGCEIGFSYNRSGRITSKDIYTGGTTDYSLSARMYSFHASVIITPGFEKVNPFAQFGIKAGTGSILYEYVENSATDVLKQKVIRNGGIGIGATGSIGIRYQLGKNIFCLGELTMTGLSYAPARGEIIQFEHNGVDKLPGMTRHEKNTEYVRSFSYDNNQPPVDSEPRKELRNKYPFSSVGISFSCCYSF